MGGSARGVADDDRIGAHGHDRLGGVLEGLALGYRRPLGGEVDDIRAQPLGGRLEGQTRAGGVLEEEVDNGLAPQGGQLLDGMALCGGHRLSGVENHHGLVVSQVLGAQQVLHRAFSSEATL